MLDYLLKAIKGIRPSRVLHATGKEIKKIHEHIFWSPCVCHALTLIFKDFASGLPWLRDTYKAEKNTVKYYVHHTYLLARFRDHSKLELPKVPDTRFA